ncbi:MAG: tRNA (adenosine(37)-N6)-threonylcarbamoyltransferase complex transferase subunit TsaD [Proteobacteria bacterium]|nr:tRNA (adenosine(37)-N6)-threonylcarbamoyltransferase complex transferase subunit TsaD [Pseudomonadota bacterium]
MRVVLGIETSCDETAVAAVREDGFIIANEIHSQIDLHKEFGGVVPEFAARSHLKILQILYNKALIAIEQNKCVIDVIAVTVGPGLIGSLIVGLMFAKGLAIALNSSIFGINHLEAHILVPRMIYDIKFPYLSVLMSGGHCQIIFTRGVGMHEIISTTLDDAAGEVLDKIARELEIGYPGGPIIEKLASDGNENAFNMPKALCGMRDDKNFSFSGLKTHVKKLIQKLAISKNVAIKDLSMNIKCDICASLQKTIAEIFVYKLKQAIQYIELNSARFNKMPDTIVLSGGVAANYYIRKYIAMHLSSQKIICPPKAFCTDNGVMIAWSGVERLISGNLKDSINIEPRARWSIDEV